MEYDAGLKCSESVRKMRIVATSGIGIHPSYYAGIEKADVKTELTELKSLIEEPVNITRQHFLRFEWHTIFQLWEEAGLHTDSSIGFRHHVGFRMGTAYPLYLFDLKNDRRSNIREIPLIYMDVSAKRASKKNGVDLLTFTRSFLEGLRYNSHICFNIHNSSFDDLGLEPWMDDETYAYILSFLNC